MDYITLPVVVFYVVLGILLLMTALNITSFYLYKRLLYLKSKKHEVEFLMGNPIVLIPEKDYIELKHGKESE